MNTESVFPSGGAGRSDGAVLDLSCWSLVVGLTIWSEDRRRDFL